MYWSCGGSTHRPHIPASPSVLGVSRVNGSAIIVWSYGLLPLTTLHPPPFPSSHNTQRVFYSRSCHQRGQAAPEHSQLLSSDVVASPPAPTCCMVELRNVLFLRHRPILQKYLSVFESLALEAALASESDKGWRRTG